MAGKHRAEDRVVTRRSETGRAADLDAEGVLDTAESDTSGGTRD